MIENIATSRGPGPVGAQRVLAQDALEARADAGDRTPRALVAGVGLELHARCAEDVEGVLESSSFALGLRRVPRQGSPYQV